MKTKKLLLPAIFIAVIVIFGLMTVFVISLRSADGEIEADLNADYTSQNEPSKDETIISNTIFEDNGLSEFPNYYHPVSDTDASSVYLSGAGGIYRIDSESGIQTLYSSPYIGGVALYRDYIFSLEYTVSYEGMVAELIKIDKKSSDKDVLIQVNPGSYDLKIIDNTLILSEEIIKDNVFETVYEAYSLDAEGNLTSDTPEDAYSHFGKPDEYEKGMRFLINPWFSKEYFGYFCFAKPAGVMDINSIWIKKDGQQSAVEVVVCSGKPLAAQNRIFYCDRDGKSLMQCILNNSQETTLYEIPADKNLSLLTYDAEWVYFLQTLGVDEIGANPSSIMRVNLQDHRTEEIYELQAGEFMSNFNVYGNNCYFILSSADADNWWECCDLIDFKES